MYVAFAAYNRNSCHKNIFMQKLQTDNTLILMLEKSNYASLTDHFQPRFPLVNQN